MTKRRLYLLIVLLAAAVVLALPAGGWAATAKKRLGGVTVSPALQDIVLAKGQPEATFDYSITNNTGQPIEFGLSVTDFGSLDESGGVLFVGEAQKTLQYKYGLTSWVTLGKDRVVVEPGKTEKISITITNRESLAPGGHYGAIMVKPVEDGSRNKVQVNQVASSLLFVKKQGGEVYNLSLNSYDVERHIFKAPSRAELRFRNSGNVHVIPRGMVTVTDPLGRTVQRGLVNPQSALALPETFRQVPVVLQTLASMWVPGRYEMTISYRYDDQEQSQTKKLTFLYVNLWFVAGLLAMAAFGLALMLSSRVRRRLKSAIRRLFGSTKPRGL